MKRAPFSAVWLRAAGFLTTALIVAAAPVFGFLSGKGVWLFAAAIVIAAACVFAAEKKLITAHNAREAHGLAFALIGLAIQCNSRFRIDFSVPYVLRVLVLAAVLVVCAWLGRWWYSVFAPPTQAERAQP